MSLFLNRIKRKNGTNASIKNSLITQLSNSIKEIQLELRDNKNGICTDQIVVKINMNNRLKFCL